MNYRLTASNGNGHGIHSPFISQFISRVLNDKIQYDAYEKIANLRLEDGCNVVDFLVSS